MGSHPAPSKVKSTLGVGFTKILTVIVVSGEHPSLTVTKKLVSFVNPDNV